jgi:hypothetical protein
MNAQFWIIDTGLEGQSQGEFCASGPYPTRKAAEQYVLSETRLLFDSSGPHLQRKASLLWCNPLHIVQVVRTVQPTIRASIKLEDV